MPIPSKKAMINKRILPSIFNSVKRGWFLITKLVKVPGKCNFLILPPSGRTMFLILVPVK